MCDDFEPCKAAQSDPHPWSTALEVTPCGRCGWSRRSHASQAEASGARRGDGSDGAITIKAQAEATINVCTPHVATLPNGSRVALPAGTVLREGTGGLDPARLLACARAVIDRDAQCPLSGPVAHDLLTRLREACGDTEEDVGARIAAEPRRRSLLGAAPPARTASCRHGTQSHYIKDGTLGCEDCDDAAKDAARIAAQEDAARDAARLGRPVYDRARGRISFKPVEVVEVPPTPIAEAYHLGMHITPEPIHEPERAALEQRIKDLQDDRARLHAEIDRLREQIENSATPADRAVGAAMLGSLR